MVYDLKYIDGQYMRETVLGWIVKWSPSDYMHILNSLDKSPARALPLKDKHLLALQAIDKLEEIDKGAVSRKIGIWGEAKTENYLLLRDCWEYIIGWGGTRIVISEGVTIIEFMDIGNVDSGESMYHLKGWVEIQYSEEYDVTIEIKYFFTGDEEDRNERTWGRLQDLTYYIERALGISINTPDCVDNYVYEGY